MALTSSQITSRLFKKSLGAGETLVNRQFFEEPRLGRDFVIGSQLWSDSSLIPGTAPVLASGASSGVVQYFEKETLTHVPGSTNLSYYSANLVDSIPFNYDVNGGSYNYQLYKNDGTTVIAFGDGDWLVDNTAGLLTFYGTLPSSVSSVLPPKISFYKYIGGKGFPTSSSGTITEIVAGLGLTGGGTVSSVTLDLSLSNNSGLTFSNNNLSIDFNTAATSLAGSGLSSNGGTLSVNVGNGLEIIADTIQLGGTLSQNTTINVDLYEFKLNNANYIELGVSGSNSLKLRNNSQITGYDTILLIDAQPSYGFNVSSQLSGGTYANLSVHDQQIKLITFDNTTFAQTFIEINTTNQTVGDGSNNNKIIISDNYGKGAVYNGDYTANFTTYSLVTKGYVDSAIPTGTSKYSETRGFTASVTETITHNLGTDEIIVQAYDSIGVMVIPGTVKINGTNAVDITFSSTLSSIKIIIIG